MMNEAYYEYDKLIMSNEKNLPAYLFNYSRAYAEKVALSIFKYVIESYLDWTPEEAKVYLTYDVVKKMKLESALSRIKFPVELDSKKDLIYVVHLIYPKKVPLNTRDRVLNIYKKVMDGTLVRLPKSFGTGPHGQENAGVCLQYVIEQNCMFKSAEEMYDFFTTSAARKLLKEHRLLKLQEEIYPTPLDYLHNSLSDNQKSELLYQKYDLRQYCKSYMQRKKKKSK